MKASAHLSLQEFIPCLCRLLARTDGVAPTSQQLATQSGLTRARVDSISVLASWDGVRIIEFLRFTKACSVDFGNLRRQREFIKRNNWSHLDKVLNRRFYTKLMRLWINHLKVTNNASPSAEEPSQSRDV